MKIAGHNASTWFKFAARMTQQGMRRTRSATKRALGIRRPVRIVPYRGFGNGRIAVISGRMLVSRPVREPLIHDPWWTNMRHIYRHLMSEPVGLFPVSATYEGQTLDSATDHEGYFHFRFEGTGEVDTPHGWHPVELGSTGESDGRTPKAIGQIMVPPADTQFGVISDMDDTVIRSYAFDFWKIARLTMLQNARTRKPFEGIAAFYRALQAGGDGSHHNPLFYVSSSLWPLYDLFRVFLEHNHLPSGPILLRDPGADAERFRIDQGHGHKLLKIESIFAMYPNLKFVLVGDSGQEDAFLYREVMRREPRRVQAIYIRDVGTHRSEEVRRVAEEVTAEGVPMRLVPDTVAAAEHAADLGLIDPSRLPEIRADRLADEVVGG